jgi:hypothetical protein
LRQLLGIRSSMPGVTEVDRRHSAAGHHQRQTDRIALRERRSLRERRLAQIGSWLRSPVEQVATRGQWHAQRGVGAGQRNLFERAAFQAAQGEGTAGQAAAGGGILWPNHQIDTPLVRASPFGAARDRAPEQKDC